MLAESGQKKKKIVIINKIKILIIMIMIIIIITIIIIIIIRNDLRSITNTDKELGYERCQKWILNQNVNIVKKFYEFV